MSLRTIVRLGHPQLRTPAAPVDPEQLAGAELQQLIDDLIDTMHEAGGVGLAAPQVAVGLQIFVYEMVREEPEEGIPLRVVINPMIEPAAGDLVDDWEGCLSIPELRGLVPRHPTVRVRALDRHGEPQDYLARDFEARIIQHEFDHLNGVIFLDRMRNFRSLAYYDEWREFFGAEVEPGGPESAVE